METLGGCLIQADGPLMSFFDALPKTIRQRIAESNFQLCAACVWDYHHVDGITIVDTLQFIDWMEKEIRANFSENYEANESRQLKATKSTQSIKWSRLRKLS